MSNITKHALVATSVILASSSAHAVLIQLTYTTTNNLGTAPAAYSFHDGSGGIFAAGDTASAGLEFLAEQGGPMGLIGELNTATPSATNGAIIPVGGPGPFTPGMSNSVILNVPASNNMLDLAAMLLPSNDWIIGTGGTSIDVSSILGGGLGATNTFSFSNVYDAGTESENFANSPGNPIISIPGGMAPLGDTQGGVVTLVTGADPFASFAGLPNGFDTTPYDFNSSGYGSISSLTVTVVPEPSTALLGSLAGLGLFLRRRR